MLILYSFPPCRGRAYGRKVDFAWRGPGPAGEMRTRLKEPLQWTGPADRSPVYKPWSAPAKPCTGGRLPKRHPMPGSFQANAARVCRLWVLAAVVLLGQRPVSAADDAGALKEAGFSVPPPAEGFVWKKVQDTEV